MTNKSHFTTRRGFIAAMGFGGVGLYGLWAAYGAAPGPLALLGMGGHGEHAEDGGGHGGHGAGAHGGPTAEEFSRMTAEFIERYRLPDGTVYPRALSSAPVAIAPTDHSPRDHGGMDHGGMDHGTMDHGGMDHGGMDHGTMDHGTMDHGTMDHGTMDHGTMDHGTMDHGATIGADGHARPDAASGVGEQREHAGHANASDHAAGADDVREVLLAAGKWYYQPHALRLDVGQAYRFKMMAVDVSHGASIQFGNGGRIVRLRPGRLTEMDVTFNAPGRFLVYCTVYCGPAHDYMQATIEVV